MRLHRKEEPGEGTHIMGRGRVHCWTTCLLVRSVRLSRFHWDQRHHYRGTQGDSTVHMVWRLFIEAWVAKDQRLGIEETLGPGTQPTVSRRHRAGDQKEGGRSAPGRGMQLHDRS